MNIMTIDPGYRLTGIFATKSGRGIGFVIDTTGLEERRALVTIYNDMEMWIQTYLPDIVVIEDYGYAGTSQNQMQVAEAKGVIKQVIYSFRNIKIINMPIQTWKKYIPKNIVDLKKSKPKYLEAVEKEYGYKAATKDEADAYMMYLVIKQIIAGILKTDSARKIYEQLKEVK